MKNLLKIGLLVLLVALIPTKTKGQVCLNCTLYEIKVENPTQDFEKTVMEDGQIVYSTNYEYGKFAYFFSGDYVLYCAYYIDSYSGVNALVQYYNNKYVIVSDTEWKAYVSGGIFTIRLMDLNGVRTFIYN